MMRKSFMIICLFCVLILSGCFWFTDFNQSCSLAENALKNGSGTNALNYADEALFSAKSDEEKATAYMLKGYAYYLLNQYSSASSNFGNSLNYSESNDSYSGKILSLYMMGSESLVPEYLDEVNSMPENWSFELNSTQINKTALYNIIALSSKLVKNQQKFNDVQSHVEQELVTKLEAFFNE